MGTLFPPFSSGKLFYSQEHFIPRNKEKFYDEVVRMTFLVKLLSFFGYNLYIIIIFVIVCMLLSMYMHYSL